MADTIASSDINYCDVVPKIVSLDWINFVNNRVSPKSQAADELSHRRQLNRIAATDDVLRYFEIRNRFRRKRSNNANIINERGDKIIKSGLLLIQ